MALQSVRIDEVLEIAQYFRERAAEALDTHYHCLMLRTAMELEELVAALVRRSEIAASCVEIEVEFEGEFDA